MSGTIIRNTTTHKRKQIIANKQTLNATCQYCGAPTKRKDRDCGRCQDKHDVLPTRVTGALTILAAHPEWNDGSVSLDWNYTGWED